MGDIFSGFKSFEILAVANFAYINSNGEELLTRCTRGHSLGLDANDVLKFLIIDNVVSITQLIETVQPSSSNTL